MWYLRMFVFLGLLPVWMVLINPLNTEVLAQGDVEEVSQVERDQIVNETVVPFIHALQSGDVKVLEHHIDGELANTLGKLIRQNTEYPDFLRNRYGGSGLRETIKVFHLKSSTGMFPNEKELRTAVVHMNRADGGQENFQLSIEKNEQGNWKIIDKKMIP